MMFAFVLFFYWQIIPSNVIESQEWIRIRRQDLQFLPSLIFDARNIQQLLP